MLTTLALAVAMVTTMLVPALAAVEKKAPTLNATKKTIVIGKTFNFNINNKIKGSSYEWTSSNEDVVTVNEKNGVVTGVAKGQANIHCKIDVSGTTYRLTAKVTVLKPAVKVEISNPVDSLDVKEYYRLKTKLTPESSDDIITWTSSDEDIADIEKDGSFVAKKSGKVTFTAKALSGRSASVTIKILKDGEEYVEEEETETPDDDEITEDKKDDVKVIKTVYSEDFASSSGGFTGRGAAKVSQTTAGMAAEGGKGYLSVTDRTANWNGATVDVTNLVTPGATYRVSGWVRFTSGEDVEVLKISQQRDDKDGTGYPMVSGDVEVEKGKWTKISGIMEVSPSTTNSNVYFEANNLIDFYVDNVVIEQIEAELIKEDVVEVEKAKVGDSVYENDFEGEKVLDPRGSSERTITTKYAHNGKASLEVKRSAGWDGAGVRFNLANNIIKASYFGKTVHTSVYVMYDEGPDEVNFKLNNKLEKADNSDNILSQIPVKKGEWTKIEADCYIADGATGDMIFIETENNDALTFYMDDIELKVVK